MRKIVITFAAALTVAACTKAAEPPSQPYPDTVTDVSVPEFKLLNDALQIDFDRRQGETRPYSLVPTERPPGLLRMTPGGTDSTDGASVTSYAFGERRVQALVELSPKPTDTCELIKDGQLTPESRCVRDDKVGSTYVTVYFTEAVSSADEAAAFWAKTPMAPIDEVGWFTDLLTRAKAATTA
ncbi:hypothetical protein Q0Z83_066150 [Actinoplanes sichuanensis]|uniref:Lipoprotein n=1 Tax=Actinoplanes sichuanensis TaxID=512349 RepID=A0ABW4AP56_9ACTN|nr:hypothetical protein [Actinoplanes sichuanensis]BEL08424.1 hypothetical protein Q0Z83_066150 [Actinoplanes sichuanensis]